LVAGAIQFFQQTLAGFDPLLQERFIFGIREAQFIKAVRAILDVYHIEFLTEPGAMLVTFTKIVSAGTHEVRARKGR
jgi:hypothetical protein